MIEILGLITLLISIGGVVQNNRLKISCFYLWLVSNAISAAIHAVVGPWSLVVRDIVFFILCIDGIRRWRKNGVK